MLFLYVRTLSVGAECKQEGGVTWAHVVPMWRRVMTGALIVECVMSKLLHLHCWRALPGRRRHATLSQSHCEAWQCPDYKPNKLSGPYHACERLGHNSVDLLLQMTINNCATAGSEPFKTPETK